VRIGGGCAYGAAVRIGSAVRMWEAERTGDAVRLGQEQASRTGRPRAYARGGVCLRAQSPLSPRPRKAASCIVDAPAVTRASDGARVSRPPIARHSRSPPTSSVVFLSYSDSNTALAGSTRIECRAVVNRVPCCCHMSAESCRKSTKMRLHRSLRASVASSPLSSCGRPGSMMRRSGGDAAQGAFIACIAVCTWSGFRSRPCTPPSWLPCWLAAPAAS
jgi:hypothetical protein